MIRLSELKIPLAALQQHPDLQVQRARVVQADAGLQQALAEKRPDWAVEVAYGNRAGYGAAIEGRGIRVIVHDSTLVANVATIGDGGAIWMLGGDLDEVLAAGEITVAPADAGASDAGASDAGAPAPFGTARYYDLVLPLAEGTAPQQETTDAAVVRDVRPKPSCDQRRRARPNAMRLRLRIACTATCGSSAHAWMHRSPPV